MYRVDIGQLVVRKSGAVIGIMVFVYASNSPGYTRIRLENRAMNYFDSFPLR